MKMTPELQLILTLAQRCGLAHNNGVGGQYILVATEAQLVTFAAAMSTAFPAEPKPAREEAPR